MEMELFATDLSSRLIVPADERSVGTGGHIEFSNGECALGEILIARSSTGICAILFGLNVGELEDDLAARFPDRRLIRNERGLRDDLFKVIRFVATPKAGLNLTLDIRGTPFQRRVWNALRTIPVGKPLTYAQLARRISEPKSVREIARACAANAIALAIPCHRVMGHSGTLTGYRWGVERKQALNNREAAPSAPAQSSPLPSLRYPDKNRSAAARLPNLFSERPLIAATIGLKTGEKIMSKQDDNKAIVGRWFADFWGKMYNVGIVDELAAPDMLLQYSLHEPRRGRVDIKAFMKDFRGAFPDLNFWGAADLIAEGDYVVGRWEGGGTHTGPAFSDFLMGSLPANSGRKMRFTGTTVLKLKDGKIVEEIGLDDGVTALQQLGLMRAA
jgi:O-6-methylguanine DNA methyltransferase